MAGRLPPREPGHREIETAPEEMHRACLAEKPGTKELEDAIGLQERAPEAVGRGGVIASMTSILREADRFEHLVRHLVDRDRDAEAVQEGDRPPMEIGNGLRLERKAPLLAATCAREEAMSDEIELDLEDFAADRDLGGAEPARGDIERDLPAVIEPGGSAPDGPCQRSESRVAMLRLSHASYHRPDWAKRSRRRP
ncbi:MAG: hypothetical protein JO110_18545 [Acetobacteraceae bacterium]|nr:hypothetical protein [Acetobacteraceae bacterium]